MSFRCQNCKGSQPVHSKPNRVVIQTRNKVYPERRDRDNNVIDKGGSGYEVAAEMQMCNDCVRGENSEQIPFSDSEKVS